MSATIPPTFTAKFTTFDFAMAAGPGEVQGLFVRNPTAASRSPMPEGSTPPPGDLGLDVQLYPPGPTVPAQASLWPIVESATLPFPLTGKPLEVTHFRNPEGGADVLIVQGKFTLPDGRVLDILGRTTSPDSVEEVATLLQIALSVEVN